MTIHHAEVLNGRADVFVIPVSWVCLDCGFSTYRIPSIELQALRDGDTEDALSTGQLFEYVCSDRLRGQYYGASVPTVPTPTPIPANMN
jgi:hypothetical protein